MFIILWLYHSCIVVVLWLYCMFLLLLLLLAVQADPTHMSWVTNEHDRGQSEAKSANRIRKLHMMPPFAHLTPDVLSVQRSKYGLGDRRTMSQFINFTGIDTIHLAVLENRCGNIEYVPFREHPFGPGSLLY